MAVIVIVRINAISELISIGVRKSFINGSITVVVFTVAYLREGSSPTHVSVEPTALYLDRLQTRFRQHIPGWRSDYRPFRRNHYLHHHRTPPLERALQAVRPSSCRCAAQNTASLPSFRSRWLMQRGQSPVANSCMYRIQARTAMQRSHRVAHPHTDNHLDTQSYRYKHHHKTNPHLRN